MKAILKFTLPEEREDFKRMSKADDLCSVLYEFKEWLKRQMDNETETGQYELAWKELFDLMEIHGKIELNELITWDTKRDMIQLSDGWRQMSESKRDSLGTDAWQKMETIKLYK